MSRRIVQVLIGAGCATVGVYIVLMWASGLPVPASTWAVLAVEAACFVVVSSKRTS